MAAKLGAIRPEDYGALVVPGGKAPEALRQDAHALERVRHFFVAGKLAAATAARPAVRRGDADIR